MCPQKVLCAFYWQFLMAKPTRIHFMFTFFLQKHVFCDDAFLFFADIAGCIALKSLLYDHENPANTPWTKRREDV